MDSKRTKAIQRPFIKTVSKNKGLAKSIAKPSQGLKNISTKSNPKSRYSSWQRGLESEKFTQRYYEELGYQVYKERFRTPFAEVDIIFRHPQKNSVLVEVKTVNSFEFLEHRLQQRQKQRLQRAQLYLSHLWGEALELHLAFVSSNGEVLVFDDLCG